MEYYSVTKMTQLQLYTPQKEPDIKKYIFCDSIYKIKKQASLNYIIRSQMAVIFGKEGGGYWFKTAHKEAFWVLIMFYFLTWVVVT